MFRYLLLALLAFVTCLVKAQSDTLKVSEEFYEERDPNLILVPSSRLRPLFDESQVLKIGIGAQSIGSSFQNGLNNGNFVFIDLTYERKFKKSPWSVTASLIAHDLINRYSQLFNGFGFYNSRSISANEWETSSGKINYQLDLGVKYYYRQKKRLSKGVGGNNLNGSYLGATLWNVVTQETEVITRFQEMGGRSIKTKETQKDDISVANASLYLSWGNQVRILGRGYLDLNIGPVFDVSKPSNWSVIMNLEFSIAIWKK